MEGGAWLMFHLKQVGDASIALAKNRNIKRSVNRGERTRRLSGTSPLPGVASSSVIPSKRSRKGARQHRKWGADPQCDSPHSRPTGGIDMATVTRSMFHVVKWQGLMLMSNQLPAVDHAKANDLAHQTSIVSSLSVFTASSEVQSCFPRYRGQER